MMADEETVEDSEEASSEEDEELENLQSSMTEESADVESVDEEEDDEPQPPVLKHDGRFYGTGRRKQSVARVWIEAGGDGNIIVNDRDFEGYFNNRRSWLKSIRKPLEALNFADDVDVWATLEGGGLTGQAGALQLGIARAFVEMDENARHFLRQADLLTRDDRAVERKKINQPGARAKQQVSKR